MSEIQPVILSSSGRDCRKLAEQIRDLFGDVIVHLNPQELGAAVGTKDAIIKANSVYPEQKHILFLEDDIEVSDKAAERIDQLHIPQNVGVVSLCDMREMASKHPEGLYVRDALGCDQRGWWGNQAILIHKDIVRYVCEADWNSRKICTFPSVMAHAINYGDLGKNCSDLRLSIVVNDHPKRNKYAVYVPSLFKHVGMRSACFPDRLPVLGERETRNWIGDYYA